MSALYNLFAGSLSDLRTRFDAVDLADGDAVRRLVERFDPEAHDLLDLDEEPLEEGSEAPTVLAALVHGTWVASPGELLNWLDRREQDDLLRRAATLLPERAGGLLGDLFEAPPLGVSPSEWGFCGSLDHAEVVELRDALHEVLDAEALEQARSSSAPPLADGPPLEQRLAWVHLSLREVPDGCDVAVRLG